MGIISIALNNWLQRHQNVSVMRQASASVCEVLPPATKDKMVDISEASARWEGIFKVEKLREKGTPITQDYTLGDVRTGTREKVIISRPKGTIGTYHTHPFGSPFPSPHDTIDAMDKDDKIMCIGATGKPGTKVQCFTPNKPRWPDLQYKFRLLYDDINDFNRKLSGKYKTRGARLRQLLEGIGSPTYIEMIQQTTLEGLKGEAVKTEKSAKASEDAIRMADIQAIRAKEAIEVAQIALGKAVAKEEIRIAEEELRIKEDEARRAAAKTGIERRLARDARAVADRVAFGVESMERGVIPTTESEEAIGYMREATILERRRGDLTGNINSELRRLRYPKEWTVFSHGEYVPYFEAFPNMFNKCRIIWEGFDEELPYEL